MVGARLFVAIVVPGLAALSADRCDNAAAANTSKTTVRQYSLEESKSIAEAFVAQKAACTYIGSRDSLKLVSVAATANSSQRLAFTFEYDSRDADGESFTITSHRAVVVMAQGKIKAATLDDKWDMLRQKPL